jgi:hypothetical protein
MKVSSSVDKNLFLHPGGYCGSEPMSLMAQQLTGDEGLICVYIVVLMVILVVLYVSLFIYQRFFARKRRRQHACRYCGHMVNVVSDCCHAPVYESFPRATCSKCGQATKMLCAICKRQT